MSHHLVPLSLTLASPSTTQRSPTCNEVSRTLLLCRPSTTRRRFQAPPQLSLSSFRVFQSPVSLTSSDLPQTPRSPTIALDGPNSIRLSWTAPLAHGSTTSIDGTVLLYEVQVDSTLDFNSANLKSATVTAASGTTTAISSLTPGVLYYGRVRAVNDAGSGNWTTTSAAVQAISGDAWIDF